MSEEQLPHEPDKQPPEINPYDAPQTSASRTDAERGRQRSMLIVAGVFLVPIASVIGGGCCCFAGALLGSAFPYYKNSGLNHAELNLALGGFVLGAAGAAGLIVNILRKQWKKL